MLNAIDIANFFVDLANSDSDDCMTNLRVNKLIYFAQAWSLVRRNVPLFSEEIQAWTYGPVVQSVYQVFKGYGRDRIQYVHGDYSPDIFSSEELELLIDVAQCYGRFTSPALVDITHASNSPWKRVFSENENNVISKESLREYFSALKELEGFHLNELCEEDFVGYRDKEGYLVLPREISDAE